MMKGWDKRRKKLKVNKIIPKQLPLNLIAMSMLEHVMSLSVKIICDIASLKTNVDISDTAIPSEMIRIVINILQSDSVTPEEQALRHFTCQKLRILTTWSQ